VAHIDHQLKNHQIECIKWKLHMQQNSISKLGVFADMPVVGIVRHMTMDDFSEVLAVYYESGLRNIEITMNTYQAVDMIRYAKIHFGEKLHIGAGTVTTQTELADALQAGAEFIVTPVLNEAVIHDCNKLGVPVIPGAFTPTEIFKAWSAGGTMVKIFPAASLGLQFIKDVRGPLNNIPLMPTGGIDHKNVNAFFKAGASVVGVGSRLFDLAMIKEKNWNGLMNHFMTFANAVRRT